MDGLVIGEGSLIPPPNELSEALDCDLYFTTSGTDAYWTAASGMDDEYYYEADCARSHDNIADDNECSLQTIVEVDSAETVKFYWKVSSQASHDYLQFYVDSTLKDQISGNVDWQQKSYAVSSGIHILKWRYVKDGTGQSGDDCGWVDFVQWTGPSPAQDPENWQQIAYKHDISGRRIDKKVDGYSTRYVYDGHHVIAEYDGNNNLLRKYIYGPGIDQPVSMIEVADANATYYYHFDALGSVVALSDSSGDTVQTYEYSVYGEVAVEDANHPNPYMFAGRRYDIEIGLYYNRARYYNPFMGRFLQTDPIGYDDGINWYAYCKNNPLNFADPSGLGAGQDGSTTFLPWPGHTIIKVKPYIPKLGTDWSWLDYWAWYLNGGGETVDIHGTGLFEEFVNDPQIIKIMDDWENYVIGNAMLCYLQKVGNGVPEEYRGWRISLHPTELRGYNLDEGSDWWAWGAHWGSNHSNLLILGDGDPSKGHGVSVAADGVVNDDGTYDITFTYTLHDEFSCPLNVTNNPDLDWEFGDPYMLTATWTRPRKGSFME
ncbi:MAG: hypothetical protein A2Z25_22810 [Planctomycetes bacterium RBG_16_55_9]|nr:MAG: hypothetical protein A2Z25_22810 [Planctomycetes bacterium RBG_16_55_9]